jgi:F-type H+-transporting ATPase subunit b
MLSRLALTRGAGSLYPVLQREVNKRLSVSLIRNASKAPAATAAHDHRESPKPAVQDDGGSIQRTLAHWEAANKIYFGPERDTVNFPIKVQPLTNPPVRLGFIPETWFQALYEKTGVTGPYVFGVGFITYVLSKEIWIIEHNFTHFLAFWAAVYIIIKKYGGTISKFLDSSNEQVEARLWWNPINKTKDQFKKVIEEQEKAIWREDGQKYLFEAKRENVDLQLESVYRQRLAEVYQAVKKRLDYQVDIQSAQRRIQQQHMVQWIVDGVMAGITPQQEKDSLAKCIADLKTIAAKHATAAPAY